MSLFSRSRKSNPKSIAAKCAVIAVAICVAFGTVAVIYLVGCIVWLGGAPQRTATKLSELRAKGEPTNAIELAELYELPADVTDATEQWDEAISPFNSPEFDAFADSLPKFAGDDNQFPALNDAWPEETVFAEILDKYKDELSQLRNFASAESARRDELVVDADGFPIFTETLTPRNAVRMLALDCVLCARTGDTQQVVNNLVAIHHIGESMRYSPELVPQLVRDRCHAIGNTVLEFLLPQLHFSDQQLAQLTGALANYDVLEGCQRAMMCDRAVVLMVNDASLKQQSNVQQNILVDAWKEAALDYFTPLVEASKRSLHELIACGIEMEQQLESESSKFNVKRVRLLSVMLMLPGHTWSEAIATTKARRNTLMVTVAAMRYRNAHSRWPDTLDQLTPEWLPTQPNDPFDGQPMRYDPQDDRITVYSVGTNSIDDSATSKNDADIVMSYGLPPTIQAQQ